MGSGGVVGDKMGWGGVMGWWWWWGGGGRGDGRGCDYHGGQKCANAAGMLAQ